MAPNLNRISIANTKKAMTSYRRWKWYSKLIIWASIVAIPTVFFLARNDYPTAGVMATGLSLFCLCIHLLLTYTKYLAFIIPTVIHIVTMPLVFGIYWAAGRLANNGNVSARINDIYVQGAFFGIVYCLIAFPLMFKFTRGRLWLSFLILYVSVDLLGVLASVYMQRLGLWIPVIITAIVLLVRSELIQRLIFKRQRYVIAEDNIFARNKHDQAQENVLDALEKANLVNVPLHTDSFFDYLVITPNRIFAVYALHLGKKLSTSLDSKGDIKLISAGEYLDQEIGYIGDQASSLSKKWRISARDITPVVVCDNTSPKGRDFIGVAVNQKGATFAGSNVFSGMVYFLNKDNVDMLHTAWKKHTVSTKTTKTINSTFFAKPKKALESPSEPQEEPQSDPADDSPSQDS